MNEFKILQKLRETIKNKKEEIYTKFEKHIFNIKKPNRVYDNSVPVSNRTFFFEVESQVEKNNDKPNLLEKSKEMRFEAKKFDYKYVFKDIHGNVIKNPSLEDVNQKYSDDNIVNNTLELKVQRHITKAKSKNLDDTYDNIVETNLKTKEAFSFPETLEKVKEIANESLKISEARGIVVHNQNEMFRDYFHINEAVFRHLEVTAANLSADYNIDYSCAPFAEVILHSSLCKSTESSFVNSSEIVSAKIIARDNNTSILVTGDVPVTDPEVQSFIGNRRLIIIDSAQTNFDFYFKATLANGEQVIFRGDKKDRPINRLDNDGELNNSDANTFMLVGKVESSILKEEKVQNFCDKQIYKIKEKIEDLKSQHGADDDFYIQCEIEMCELQILNIETYRISKDLSDLKDYFGLKPIFIENQNNVETDNTQYEDECDCTKIVD